MGRRLKFFELKKKDWKAKEMHIHTSCSWYLALLPSSHTQAFQRGTYMRLGVQPTHEETIATTLLHLPNFLSYIWQRRLQHDSESITNVKEGQNISSDQDRWNREFSGGINTLYSLFVLWPFLPRPP